MNHTKTKTFIAFINKMKKDTYWIDGNYIFDEEVPKIYPYESREDKDIANLVGYRLSQFHDVELAGGEIVGVILKATDETISTITKEKAIELEQKIYGNTIYESNKKIKKEKKVVEEVVQEPIAEKIVEKVVEAILEKKIEPETISEEPKKRGRPRKLQVID